jgi:hypothetical protein
MKGRWIRVFAALGAFALLALAISGCDPSGATDAVSLLAKGSSDESAAVAEAAGASGGLKDGMVPDATQLDQVESKLESSKTELSEAVEKGGLSEAQKTQATAAQQRVEGAEGEVSADQAVAQDAPKVTQDTSETAQATRRERIEQKLAERAESLICKKLRQAVGSEPASEKTAGEETSEVESELEVEQSVAQTLTSDVRTVAGNALQRVENVVNLNSAGRATILNEALNHFACAIS